MKVLTILALFLAISTQSVKAEISNLDNIPKTKEETLKLIRRKKIEQDGIKDISKIYLDLVKDTNKTANQSRLLMALGVSSFVGSYVGAVGQGMYLSESILFHVSGAAATMAGLSAIGFDSEESSLDKIKQNAAKEESVNLKYSEANKELDNLHNEVMNEYFDGSMMNTIMDHLRLGGISKTGARKLLTIQLIKLSLIQKEIKDLESVALVLSK
jgi:hypothetical protein